MLSLSVLEKTTTSILYEMPAGKPDPTQTYTAGEDKRERVLQFSPKGDMCWYYTFNFIRQRIGKHPSDEFLEARKIESICSKRRKKLTAYENQLPISLGNLYSTHAHLILQQLDKNATLLLLQSPPNHLCRWVFHLNARPNITSYMQQFLNTDHPNMFEFLVFNIASKTLQVNMEFLRDSSTNLNKEAQNPLWPSLNIIDIHLLERIRGYQKLPISEQSNMIASYISVKHAHLYKLNLSSWSPSQDILDLIKELKTKGPLMIMGFFGDNFYLEQPFKTRERISGRDIYAWRPGATRVTYQAAHSVLLVGAKKVQKNAFAYFIDANNPSDPRNRESQKIYKISFKNLTSNILTLVGTKEDTGIGYAYYGNFNLP